MVLHIFNPEHDLALAVSDGNFTAPHAGRQLRDDLGFLPALWAQKGDGVLVRDKEAAMLAYSKIRLVKRTEVHFVTTAELKDFLSVRPKAKLSVWGWDRALANELKRAGVSEMLMPSRVDLDTIRDLSNRRLAVEILDKLKDIPQTTGFSRVCNTYEELLVFLDNNVKIVVKAPWSSSGRGVRYVHRETVDVNTLQWICNTIKKQMSVTAEIYCDKVLDFAVEFVADKKGVYACGLSLFNNIKSAYFGNVLCREREKIDYIAKYIPLSVLDEATKRIEMLLTSHLSNVYQGPLGVDMMIVADTTANRNVDGQPHYLLNPCVEINLRRTMGHVALALSNVGNRGTMHIEFNGQNYKLKIDPEGLSTTLF